MASRVVILAGTERRAIAIAHRRGLSAAQVTIPTKPSDLDGLVGLPVIFDYTAWSSKHADAFANYFQNRASAARNR